MKTNNVEIQNTVISNVEQNISEKNISYVVIRDGNRVSSRDYSTSTDTNAILEKDFWKLISKKHSHGEPVEIVQYDSRLHRVW